MPRGIYLHKPLTEEHKKNIGLAGIGRNKGQSLDEIYGIEKAKEVREKMRLAKLGKKRPYKSRVSKGKNHYKWKGGISKGYKTGYYSHKYKSWRKKVFEQDDFTCQHCGAQGYITAHHIKSFAHYKHLRFELSNGITLCEHCHSLTDNYKGRNKKKANTKV